MTIGAMQSYRRLFSTSAASVRCTRYAGFTAIELLVVMAIAAILVSLALPSFRDVVSRYRVQLATEQMTSAIYFARSEAIRRGGNVTLVKRATPTSTPAGCDAPTMQEWSCGWVVFVDANGNGNVDSGDLELQTAGIPNNISVTLSRNMASLTFDRWGRAAGASTFGFHFQRLSPNGGTEKQLCMSIAGRLRTLTDVPSCPAGF